MRPSVIKGKDAELKQDCYNATPNFCTERFRILPLFSLFLWPVSSIWRSRESPVSTPMFPSTIYFLSGTIPMAPDDSKLP